MSNEAERPPSKINGKKNPAYQKWYRQQPHAAEAIARYNASDKARACRQKYEPKAKNTRQKKASTKKVFARVMSNSMEKKIAGMLKEGWKVSTVVVTLGVPQSLVEKVLNKPK